MPYHVLIHLNCFVDAQSYTYAKFGKGHGTPSVIRWNCFGNETSLADCLYENTSYICYPSQHVGVRCRGEKVKGF